MASNRRAPIFVVAILLASVQARAQYTDLRAFDELGGTAEFARRRTDLMKQIKPGFAILFARIDDPEGATYREDNDFYYFTGIADPGAVLIIDGDSERTVLFEPDQTASVKLFYGSNILSTASDEQKRFGLSSIQPLANLPVNLALLTSRPNGHIWVRLGYPDEATIDRSEVGMAIAANHAHMFGTDGRRDRDVVIKLQQRYPQMQFHDLVPAIDRLRNIKNAAEIEIMRRNGQLSAEGLRSAIANARPGMFEYQIAAHAAFSFTMAGAQGVAYPAIVASGPNATVLHYFRNRRQIDANDLIVFDFAADLNHLTMDITRTFNISGAFTPVQATWYEAVLEAQTAVIDKLRPGNTYEQAVEAGRKVFEEYGIIDQWQPEEFPGHFVGEATHDVNTPPGAAVRRYSTWSMPSGPIVAGQVVAVEPTVTFTDGNLHIRIEDTVLITATGPEVLTRAVPKEPTAIQALVGSEQK